MSPNKSLGACVSDEGYATNLLNLFSISLFSSLIIIVVPVFGGGLGLKYTIPANLESSM